MTPLLTAAALGAVSGSRSMLAPALVARAVARMPFATLLSLLASGELAADKLPMIPSRTQALPLAGRIVSGAIVGASVPSWLPERGGRTSRVACAVVGAAGAVAASYVLAAARRKAGERGVPNAVAGALEDALAVTAGLLLMRPAQRTPARDR